MFVWSVQGKGKISRKGLYTAPNVKTTATIVATVGGVKGTATVMVI